MLSRLILGLLGARGNLVVDFSREDYWRDQVKLTVAIFLRSDIYVYLRSEAREPDKLPLSSVSWQDGETLLRVVSTRFDYARSSSGSSSMAPLTWETLFCEEISGLSPSEFIVSNVLPRPRDVIYFCNSALARAVDRDHPRIEEADLQSAMQSYSQYAYEALLVENGVTVAELADALFAFLGARAVLSRREVVELLVDAGVLADRVQVIVDKLITSYFLGIEVTSGVFEYPEVGTQLDRARRLASRHQHSIDDQLVRVHPAFRDFLGITAD